MDDFELNRKKMRSLGKLGSDLHHIQMKLLDDIEELDPDVRDMEYRRVLQDVVSKIIAIQGRINDTMVAVGRRDQKLAVPDESVVAPPFDTVTESFKPVDESKLGTGGRRQGR